MVQRLSALVGYGKHSAIGTARLGNTLVINCNMGRGRAGAMIEWNGNLTPRVEML